MDRQTEFVLRSMEERDIRFVRLWFTDVLGSLKSVAIAPAEVEGAIAEGVGFDGSAIEGFARVYESDMVVHPDPSTFQVLPWRQTDGGTARMLCDIQLPDGSPSFADPRHVLKRALKKAADMGFTFYIHPEIEFFLLGQLNPPVPLDDGGYFDHTTLGDGTDFRRDAITMLEQMGISVEFSHHEGSPGQHEIDLRYADALTMGDTNIFHDGADEYRLSKTARQFVAGLLRHAPEITAVTNQWVNSYKRLMGGSEAPTCACWGRANRSALIRVPQFSPGKASSARIEYRAPDPACNPYLAFALMLNAGLAGIENEYPLPEETEDAVWRLTEKERRSMGIKSLPRSLDGALRVMEGSELAAETLGEHVFDYFMRNKRAEFEAYRRQVTPWEIARHIRVL